MTKADTVSKKPGRPALPDEEKKKSTSFYLSGDTKRDLKALAKDMRISQASVIETLVEDAAKKRGLIPADSSTK